MKALDAVLFDLDGTLIDTAPDFVRVLNRLRADHSLAPLADETIRKQVSNGARAMVELGFGLREGEAGFEDLREAFLNRYLGELAVDTCLFPGLDDLLALLESRRIPWGIVTNKPHRFTEPLLEQLQLAERCGVTICPDHVENRKPHPEPIFKACETLGAAPENTVYVGDHQRDIESGNNAGNRTIAVTWGYIPDDQDPRKWNADHIVDDANALTSLIHSIINTAG